MSKMEWNVSTPCDKADDGRVRIEAFNISQSDADFANMRSTSITRVKPGAYKRLMVGRDVMMSNTHMERITNQDFVRRASGKVLINGLGLGMVIEELLKKPEVEHITVVEYDAAVISLVAPTFAGEERVSIIHADAFGYKPPKGQRYDYVWHDIWPFITPDNLPQMARLHRKYARRAGWQGSWAKDLCQLAKRGYRF